MAKRVALGSASMTARRVVVGLAALAAGLVTGSGAASAASAEKGKVEFMKHGCWQCHGEVGQGGVGPKLAPDPIPYDTLSNFVRTTNRNMPSFSEHILSNDDLLDIYAYLQSIPKGPDPKSIAILNQ
jgi:ubiquinol-cytochrome c reductase cytochrome c subunit